MNLPMRASITPGVVAWLCAAAAGQACVQGETFHPATPFPSTVPPIAVRPAPLNLDQLFPAPRPLGPPALALGRQDAEAAANAARQAAFADFVRGFERKMRQGGTEAAHSLDYAVALIHLGRHEAAIEALLAREAARPGDYATAANLGTAYELMGALEDAVVWIARGIERNPQSHHGTEWLHLAILHAKLQLRGDAAWLKHHSVLDSAAGNRTSEEIVRAIDYQLGERLQFVEPADAVVCDLFYQAAVRVAGERAELRRAHYCSESLRFGEWRKAEIAKLRKS